MRHPNEPAITWQAHSWPRFCQQYLQRLTYDNRNRLTILTRTIDGTPYALGLGYDAVGNVISILYPGDTTSLTQVYDELNRLKAVNGFAGTTNSQGRWYDLAGRLIRMQYIIRVGMYWKQAHRKLFFRSDSSQ